MREQRTTIYDVHNAFYKFRQEVQASGLIGSNAPYSSLNLYEGRPRWGEDWKIYVHHTDADGNYTIEAAKDLENCLEWIPTNLTPSRGTAYRELNAATEKLRTKRTITETVSRTALDEAAALLLDNVGVATYQTLITDGLTPVEALRTAVLLGRND